MKRLASKTRLAVLACLCLSVAFSAATVRAAPKLVEARKIWSKANHNAFTDLIRFRGKWYCSFREGSGHVSADGAVRIIRSEDGKKWSSAAHMTSERADLRDPKMCVTPDGKLMVTAAAALGERASGGHRCVVWTSSDGSEWSDMKWMDAEKNMWLWRVTWHQDTAHSVGYRTGGDERFVRLYSSSDGVHYDTLVPRLFEKGYPNEATLRFLKDDRCLCVLRRDGPRDNPTAQLGISRPPYEDWTWKDLGTRIGGPDFTRLPDGRFVVAARLYDGGTRTSLLWLDPEEGTLDEFVELPSGGDTSYPGLVWREGELWVSYYSSHEGRTSIYLARVAFPGVSVER